MTTPLDQLQLPASLICTDRDLLKTYGKDWSMYFSANASAVLFPETQDHIRIIITWANTHQVSLVPSGGRTGLSSAATATNQEVVVSFEKMNKILDFNPIDRIVRVEPGVITEALQEFAKSKGLYFPIDFAAKGSSQIGGNVATNAGGVKVLRYGLIRNWISGLTVVTGDGKELKLNNSLTKNATGYDLRQLFIGSEGTLGFITQVEIQLAPQPPETKVLILGIEKLEDVLPIFEEFQKSLSISACEFFSQLALNHVLSMHDLAKPFETETPFYLLLEVEETDTQFEQKLEASFTNCFENGLLSDGVISQNSQQASDFWSLREFISESISPCMPYKNDVSVRTSKVPEFVGKAQTIIEKNYPNFEVVWFGHIGDGNVHINILKPDNMERDEFVKTCKTADPLLYKLLQDLDGSISAEHGVGLIKKDFLHYTKSKDEIEYMKMIKKIFDPNGIMNPGKIF